MYAPNLELFLSFSFIAKVDIDCITDCSLSCLVDKCLNIDAAKTFVVTWFSFTFFMNRHSFAKMFVQLTKTMKRVTVNIKYATHKAANGIRTHMDLIGNERHPYLPPLHNYEQIQLALSGFCLPGILAMRSTPSRQSENYLYSLR